MDVKETVEILDAGISVAVKMKAVLADGEISWVEGVQLAISEAPVLIKAVSGLGLVKGEMSELDRAEVELLANKGVELAKAVAALFAAGE